MFTSETYGAELARRFGAADVRLRPWMTDRFRTVLGECGVPWIEVHGDPRTRLAQALGAVDGLLAEGWQLAHPLG